MMYLVNWLPNEMTVLHDVAAFTQLWRAQPSLGLKAVLGLTLTIAIVLREPKRSAKWKGHEYQIYIVIAFYMFTSNS